jgi:hypothetical protein
VSSTRRYRASARSRTGRCGRTRAPSTEAVSRDTADFERRRCAAACIDPDATCREGIGSRASRSPCGVEVQLELSALAEGGLLALAESGLLAVAEHDLETLAEIELLSLAERELVPLSERELLPAVQQEQAALSERGFLAVAESEFVPVAEREFVAASERDFHIDTRSRREDVQSAARAHLVETEIRPVVEA